MKALGLALGVMVCLLPLAMYGFLHTMPHVERTQDGAQLHRLFTTPEGCNVYSFRNPEYDHDTLHYMAACPGASVQGSGGTISSVPQRAPRVPM